MALTELELVAWLGEYLWPFFRIGAVLAVAPVLGTQIVPVRVRAGLAILLTGLVAPVVPPPAEEQLFGPQGVIIGLQQVVIGLAMGFSLRMVFGALEIAGQVIGNQMGLAFAEMVDPQNGIQIPTLSHFYSMLGTLVFLSLNGHHLVIELLVDSFYSLPMSMQGVEADGLERLLGWGSEMFRNALLIALPASAALMAVNLTIGLMTRAAPQFNMFVGLPVILLLGLAIIGLSLGVLVPQVSEMLDSVVRTVRAGLLAGV